MSVWVVAAGGLNDRAAIDNYDKTLAKPISSSRLAKLPKEIVLPQHDLYAWGFPRTVGGGNEAKIGNMSVGDICFFCATDTSGDAWVNKYRWVAKVIGKFDISIAREVSQAFWDSEDFYPYLLSAPVPIDMTIEDFGRSLDPSGQFYSRSPQSSSRLSDPKKLASVISSHGSVDAWASQFFEGVVPFNAMNSKKSSYLEKIPAIRDWLIRVAKSRAVVTYGEVMQAFDVDRFSLRHAMDRLGHQSAKRGEPIITALIVSKRTGRCSEGLFAEFGVVDDILERERLYELWSLRDISPEVGGVSEGPVDVRASKFASVEVRPSQAAFRRKLFIAYDGKCAISGCDLVQLLDAAHLDGRSWRLGHNEASDGVLLRKDLHALYDAKIMKIAPSGMVEIPHNISEYHERYNGLIIDLKY